MPLLKPYTESEVKPSPAARALLDSLKLPVGVAVVWPTTRAGKLTLVVQLNQSHWGHASQIPASFEGYAVKVERGVPVASADKAATFKTQLH